MTDWKHHHPPSDHPDFDAYLDTLTDEDFEATNATERTRSPERPPSDDAPDNPPKK